MDAETYYYYAIFANTDTIKKADTNTLSHPWSLIRV